jgi:hypothetical protein
MSSDMCIFTIPELVVPIMISWQMVTSNQKTTTPMVLSG